MKKIAAPLILLSVMSLPLYAQNDEFEVIEGQTVISGGTTPTPAPVMPTAPTNVSNEVYFIGTDGLRVRSTPEDAGKTMGLLSLNEKVRIVNPTLINGKYVQIQIIQTENKIQPAEKYYVAFAYLSLKLSR